MLSQTFPLYVSSISTNNQGVCAFETGEFILARHLLQFALVQMELATANCKRQHEEMSKAWPSPAPRPKGTSVIFQWSVTPTRCPTLRTDSDSEKDGCKDNETTFIYKKALAMVAQPFTTQEALLNFSNELACITYNLALVSHLLGNCVFQEVYQREALVLYGQSIAHFNDAMELATNDFPKSDINVFGMAVTCNVGQLYYDVFADYDQARKNFAKLSTWVNALKLRPTGGIVDADSIQGFVFNSFLLSPTLPAAA